MLGALVPRYDWTPQLAGGHGSNTATTSTPPTTHVTGSADCVAHTETSVTTTTAFGPATILYIAFNTDGVRL